MTRKITPAQLDEIEEVAKEATPGQWEVIGGGEYVTPIGVMVAPDDGGVSPEDATHIATFDPSTTLALVAEVRELRAKVERVREVHEPIDAMLNPGRHERVVKVCTGCGTDDGNWQRWPCPTIRALDGEAS